MNYDDWMMNLDETQTPQQQQAVLDDQKFMKKYFQFMRYFSNAIFFSIQITINYQSFHLVLIEYKPNLLCTSFFILLYALIIRSFILVTFTNTKQLNTQVSQDEEIQLTFCQKCTYHCKICQICILERDHHCYYIGGCVGQKNYKYFISYVFLIFTTSLCVVVIMYNEFKLACHLNIKSLQVSFLRVILVYPLVILFCGMSLILLVTHSFVLANDISQLSIKHQKEPFRYSLSFILKTTCCCHLKELRSILESVDETWKKRAGSWLSLVYP